jgi:protein SCO1/2
VTTHRPALLALAALAAVAAAPRAQAPVMEIPVVDAATAIDERLGAVVSGELEFVDEMRRPVRLGDYCNGKRPVILNLGYYGCPTLCGEVLNSLVDGLRGLSLRIGEDFEVVTVSFDPREKPELAREKKNSVLQVYTAPNAEAHWHFLTGEQAQIEALTKAVGFGYQWNEHGKVYDHSAALVLLSPDGKVSRYLYGLLYRPRDLRLGLVEASEGKVGSTWDRILLTCYGYDPKTQTYSLLVMTVVRVGGALTVAGIAIMLLFLWRRERRRVAPATT